ncbi:hypothetical protein HDU76_005361, partial [Blyttiomyces sp. JEL0837]
MSRHLHMPPPIASVALTQHQYQPQTYFSGLPVPNIPLIPIPTPTSSIPLPRSMDSIGGQRVRQNRYAQMTPYPSMSTASANVFNAQRPVY